MKFPKYLPLVFLSLFAGLFFFLGTSVNKNLPKTPAVLSPTPTPLLLKQQTWVKEVIDGDTIILADDTHIRYLGIDAPDQGKPYFLKAKEYNQKLVENKEVELEFEPKERKDVFGRTLAYVFIKDNLGQKKMVNLLLVEEGLADISLYSNLKYKQEFLNARNWAKEHHHGLWFEEFEKSP
jgi:endonuclease YncB( thermonuclease family)